MSTKIELLELDQFISVNTLQKIDIYAIVKKLADVEKITTILYKYDIKTAYLNNFIALYSKVPHGFAGACNEIIFSSITFEPICIPPRLLGETPAELTPDYVITKINDGTMVNLYFNAGQWYLSSAHSYDIGDKLYMGNKNYYEMFYDSLMPEFIIKTDCRLENKRLKFGNLSNEFSYTFIFHHPNIHIVGEHGIWQVQTVNLKTREINYNYFDSIPMQERAFVLDKSSPYGYICRNGEYDFILRSEYLNFIRHAVYTFPRNVELDHTNRYKYIVTRAYMTPLYRSYFKTLLPVAEEYEKIEELISNVVGAVIYTIKPKSSAITYSPEILAIAKKIIDSLPDKDMFRQIGSKDVQSVVSDYCNNAAYAHYYI